MAKQSKVPELERMAKLGEGLERFRPIDRQAVAELVDQALGMVADLDPPARFRVAAWLLAKGEEATADAVYKAAQRAAAKVTTADLDAHNATTPPAPPADPQPTGATGRLLADCDEPGHARCELLTGDDGGPGKVLHHPAKAGDIGTSAVPATA